MNAAHQARETDAALRALARHHHVDVSTDNTFQRRARILQARWREERGLPIGFHRGKPLGSRLEMPGAEQHLWNFQSEAARKAVWREVRGPGRDRDKLYGVPRIFDNLLSSQPLCFNLFAELKADFELASRALRAMTAGRVHRVTRIEFEHSPGRGDPKYTGDHSAFDVYVEYVGEGGRRGFVGIEVKYHEALNDKPGPHQDRHAVRYGAVADAMKAFRPEERARLKDKPLEQIWRDHLLAGSLRLDKGAGFADGLFAFLYPADNVACAKAVEQYRGCLVDERSFAAWTLEELVDALRAAGAGGWLDAVEDRYLGFEKVDRILAQGEAIG